jgi:tetratricopeptide (TPR) repeat protein
VTSAAEGPNALRLYEMARFTHWIGWLRAVSTRMAAVSRRLLPIALVACLSSAAPGAAQCTLPGLADPPRMPGVPFEDLSLRATEAWEAGRAEEAVRYFRAGVELNPLWHDGWWRLGLTLSEAGCHEAARDALRRVVQLRPGAGPGWTLLGVSEYRLGSYDQAFADLSRGVTLGVAAAPDIGKQGLHALTLLLIRRGDFSAPSKNLAILVRLEPDDPELVTACGLMALRRPQLPSEVPAADREVVAAAGRAGCAAFAGQKDEARRLFVELVARYPSTRGVHFAYGLVLSREGSPEALPTLRREVELFPDNAEAHLEIAFDILERGNPPEALDPARIAARLLPGSPWSHFALGRALLATGSVEDAVSELERASALGPEVRDVYVALAQAYARAGRTADVERTRATLQRLDAVQTPGR